MLFGVYAGMICVFFLVFTRCFEGLKRLNWLILPIFFVPRIDQKSLKRTTKKDTLPGGPLAPQKRINLNQPNPQ